MKSCFNVLMSNIINHAASWLVVKIFGVCNIILWFVIYFKSYNICTIILQSSRHFHVSLYHNKDFSLSWLSRKFSGTVSNNITLHSVTILVRPTFINHLLAYLFSLFHFWKPFISGKDLNTLINHLIHTITAFNWHSKCAVLISCLALSVNSNCGMWVLCMISCECC